MAIDCACCANTICHACTGKTKTSVVEVATTVIEGKVTGCEVTIVIDQRHAEFFAGRIGGLGKHGKVAVEEAIPSTGVAGIAREVAAGELPVIPNSVVKANTCATTETINGVVLAEGAECAVAAVVVAKVGIEGGYEVGEAGSVGTDRHIEVIAEGCGVGEFIDANVVAGATEGLAREGSFGGVAKINTIVTSAKAVGVAVSGLEAGGELIASVEAGVEVEANAVLEVDLFVAVVAEGDAGVKDHFACEFRGGRKLLGFDAFEAAIEAIDAATNFGELVGEVVLEALDGVEVSGVESVAADLGEDLVKAGVESGGEFVAGQGAIAAIGSVGVSGDAAVAFGEGLEGLEGPVGGLDVAELGDGGDLGDRGLGRCGY